MRRRNKIFLIVLISALITYILFYINSNNKLYIMSIGDGISSGETSFNIDGISFNDYIKDYYYNKKELDKYNDTYSYKNYKLNDLIEDIKINDLNKYEKNNINQLLHKSNIIIISIGEEELVKLSITNDLDLNYIKDFIKKYDNLLYLIKNNSEAKIIIVGFYENKYLDKTNTIILNSELSNISIKYNTIFININDLIKNSEYLFNNSYYINYKGHEKIADMIIHSI